MGGISFLIAFVVTGVFFMKGYTDNAAILLAH